MLWKYFYIIQQKTFAFFLDICYHELVRGCGEMADAADSKSADGDIVRVRLPPSAWPILALNVWFNDVRSFFNVSPNARWDRGLVHVPVLGHVPDPCPNHKKTTAAPHQGCGYFLSRRTGHSRRAEYAHHKWRIWLIILLVSPQIGLSQLQILRIRLL